MKPGAALHDAGDLSSKSGKLGEARPPPRISTIACASTLAAQDSLPAVSASESSI